MPRKNRGYKKDEPFRDARIIVIACEGLREESYFQTLVGKSRQVKLFTLSPKEEIHKSSPKWVRDRAAKFLEKFGLDGEDDELWFVMDIDDWEKSVLHEISNDCSENKKWSMALSNPCFEVWLYGHIGNPKDLEIETAQEFKTQIHKDYNGGYDVDIFTKLITNAVEISKNNDSDINSDFPKLRETKVYRLAESITRSILKL